MSYPGWATALAVSMAMPTINARPCLLRCILFDYIENMLQMLKFVALIASSSSVRIKAVSWFLLYTK